MKTNLMLVGLFVMSLFAMTLVLADSNVSDNSSINLVVDQNSSAVNISDIDSSLNESVNGWKIGWKQMGIWFTFNDEKRVEKELKLADLRLIQARIAAKNNNSAAMEKALTAHERILERVNRTMQNMQGGKDGKGVKSSAEKLVGLDRAIEVHQIKIERMNALLANENLTADEKARIESALARAENNTAKLQEVQDGQRERMKTRLMAVANMTEDESEQVIQQIEDAQNLKELKQIGKDLRQERKDGLGPRRSGREFENESEDDSNESEED